MGNVFVIFRLDYCELYALSSHTSRFYLFSILGIFMPITRDTHRLVGKTIFIFIFVGLIALGFVIRIEKKFVDIEFAISNPFNASKAYHFLVKDKTEYQVVIAGDSRAERQLIPKQIQKESGLSAVNIACSGCDIVRTYDFLDSLDAFNKHRVFIISSSAFQINDGAIDTGYLSISMLRRMNLIERLKMFGGDFYLRTNEAVSTHYDRAEYLTALRESTLPDDVRHNLGFFPTDASNPSCSEVVLNRFTTSHSWYKNWSANGARWRVMRDMLDQYALKDDYFIFFNPPTSQVWLDCSKDTFIEKAEREFSQKMGDYIARYPNMRFFDLYSDARFSRDEEFADIQHLNVRGARVLTSFFAKEIVNRGRLHERNSQDENQPTSF
jgi:hypothetical protein